MAKIKIIELSEEQRADLERGFTHGPSRAFRQRCQVILLKAGSPQAQRLTSKQVAAEVRCCEVVVNTWLKRHEVQGFQGLRTRQGQGRAPILQTETDLAAVRRAVEQNRQHISLAKAELTKAERVKELGKEFSTLTLKRFLKNGGRFKRIRRQVKPNADIYAFKRECLTEMGQLSEQGHIDLFYGDESRVSLLPCVPYAWHFQNEQVVMPSERGGGVNCFALLSPCFRGTTVSTGT